MLGRQALRPYRAIRKSRKNQNSNGVLMPAPKRGTKSRPSRFTIHEDSTATVDNITSLEDARYRSELAKTQTLVAIYAEYHESILFLSILESICKTTEFLSSQFDFERLQKQCVVIHAFRKMILARLSSYRRGNLSTFQFRFQGPPRLEGDEEMPWHWREEEKMEWKGNVIELQDIESLLVLVKVMFLERAAYRAEMRGDVVGDELEMADEVEMADELEIQIH